MDGLSEVRNPGMWRYISLSLLSQIVVAPVSARADEVAQARLPARTYYFPTETEWETVAPKSLQLDPEALNEAMDFAFRRKSSSVIILHKGRILAERHQPVTDPSRQYAALLHGKSDSGHVVEDVASCQKSVTSILVGMAKQRDLLKLSDPVSQHLGEGWSEATPQQEEKITVRHLITMTSGLNDRLRYEAPAGSKWRYNTNAYSRSLTVVAKVADSTPNEVTRKWLTEPLGMEDSKWVERQLPRIASAAANKLGFATTGRDLARFGLFVLTNGTWHDQQILTDADYLKASTSPSQSLNPSYGYLWWLNGQNFAMRGTRRVDGPLISTAPRGLFAAQGALGRKCYVVPAAHLVVVRLGDSPDRIGQKKFDAEFWRLLRKAAPNSAVGRGR